MMGKSKKLKMKEFTLFVVLASAIIGCNSVREKENPESKLSQFLWLEGDWKSQIDDELFKESWSIKNDSVLEGYSVLIKKKDTAFIEKLSIVSEAGNIFYIAQVSNQNDRKCIKFKLISTSQENFLFENKAHDFPQQIVYTHPKPDSLVAWVQGMMDGRFTKDVIRMGR